MYHTTELLLKVAFSTVSEMALKVSSKCVCPTLPDSSTTNTMSAGKTDLHPKNKF
jgi:hypothetical protein